MEESKNAMTDEDIESENIFNSWNRHLYCGVFGLTRKAASRFVTIYNQGFCKCIICEVYWRVEDCPAYLCPCCNVKVRTKRRGKTGKRSTEP